MMKKGVGVGWHHNGEFFEGGTKDESSVEGDCGRRRNHD